MIWAAPALATLLILLSPAVAEASCVRPPVDRRFEEGARYEFHPVNATSPYEDNACTATRQLAGSVAGSQSDDPLPGSLPVDEQSRPGGYVAAAAVAVAAVAAFGLLVTLSRTALLRRSRRGAAPHEVQP